MIYKDFIYGKVEIKEPVILKLINSKPVQRLKNITQHGVSVYNKYYRRRVVTRFEHSLGVYLSLKRLGCSLEEQIAGLLHDVGHTIFSHAIDSLFPEENYEFDNKYHGELVLKSEIPGILERHNLELRKIINIKKFTVLEKDLPDLCADRVDYFLRDPFFPKNLHKEAILNNLAVFNNTLVFKDKEVAVDFSKNYLKMHNTFWARPLDEVLYFLMADIFKIGLKNMLITEEDFFITEKEFLKKIERFNNKEIEHKWQLIENMNINQVRVYEEQQPNSYFVRSKIRIIDPMVLSGEKLTRLSEIDETYKKTKEDFEKNTPKERWIGYEI